MNDFDLLQAANPSAKFPAIGTTVAGTVRAGRKVQERDFSTGLPLVYNDGTPRMQTVITLDTADGTVDLYVRAGMRKAVQAAVSTANARTIEIGGTLSVTYIGDGEPTKPGFNGPKQYKVIYTAPAGTPAVAPQAIHSDDLV